MLHTILEEIFSERKRKEQSSKVREKVGAIIEDSRGILLMELTTYE